MKSGDLNSLQVDSQLLDQIEKYKVSEIPQNLVDQELKIITEGLKEDEVKKKSKEFEKKAIQRIKVGLVLNEFGEANKIKILEYVSPNLKKDKEVVYNSVKNHGSELRYADDIFKKDKELVLLAVVTDWSVYTSVDKKLQIDKDVLNILEKIFSCFIFFIN